MSFTIINQNIADMKVDAIINITNPRPVIGSGIDFEINEKAGSRLLIARKMLGKMKVGTSAITLAYNLDAKYVIHTVGAGKTGDSRSKEEVVRSCYMTALKLAAEKGCKNVACPVIPLDNHNESKEKAFDLAKECIEEFLLENDITVHLVISEKKQVYLPPEVLTMVRSYTDESFEKRRKKGSGKKDPYVMLLEKAHELEHSGRIYGFHVNEPVSSSLNLNDMLSQECETFQQALFRMIGERGLTDPQVYTRANIDRKLFSRIRADEAYHPKKITALGLAIALRLDLEETKEFIAKAGYSLTKASKTDIIIEYFITSRNYDIFEINQTLFEFGETPIGSF